MVVLSCHPRDGQAINLFTHLRHRRRTELGPWAKKPDETWSTSVIAGHGGAEELSLHTIDAPLQHCQELIDRVLDDSALEIDSLNVHYALARFPRHHRAFRDKRPDSDHSVVSPFLRHSAEVVEYWSFAEEPRDLWLKAMELFPDLLQPMLEALRFPLDRRSDRVGNLMVSRAEDAITCDLNATQNKTLVLSVDGDEVPPDAYSATVCAAHSGDDVVRKRVSITRGETVIDLHSDVDRYGFEIYRNSDGLCIDKWDVYRMMEIRGAVNIDGGPTLQLHDLKSSNTSSVNPWSSRSTINIKLDKDGPALDRQIRRLFLDRRNRERLEAARKDGDFERFGPDQLDDAVDYFLSLLSRHSYQADPIYLADPYFMSLQPGDTEKRLYLGMIEAMASRRLRILCAPFSKDQPWWKDYPTVLTNRITIRAFVSERGDRRALHDRYLVADETEVIMTNSFNGWSTGGVTFFKLPFGVYRAEAEKLWAMDIGTTVEGISVREVN